MTASPTFIGINHEHQEKQRKQTIAAAIEAAARLQGKGANLTFRSIAEEAELSHATILQPEVKNALYQKFQIGHRKKEQNSDSLQKQVTELKNSLLESRKVNAELRLQNKRLKEERDNYELKYRHLLLQYAIKIDKKIQPL